MNALIVYDSFFGNTEKVAQAIGEGLAEAGTVEVKKVDAVTPEDLAGLDILVVGSPTRSFAMSPATKELLGELPRRGLKGIRVAAFDTRFPQEVIGETPALSVSVKIAGKSAWAATHISRLLKKAGGEEAAPPEGFYVSGTEGPLLDEELDRAAAWGRQLADQ